MSIVNIHEEFDSEEAASTARDKILQWYHPAGYGTTLNIHPPHNDGKWIVSGYRYSSCD